MFMLRSVIFVSLLIYASTQNENTAKDVIGFPESEEDPDLKNKDNRIPVFIPSMCHVNELFYPGDQKDDWICDCRPSFIYHPVSDMCWPAYQKGPCAEGQYLVLKQKTDIPVCEQNPCIADGFVQWNGNCEKLGTVGPCNFMYPTAAVLGVNATSLVVSCVRISVPRRISETMIVPSVTCPPGGKRIISGKCVPS